MIYNKANPPLLIQSKPISLPPLEGSYPFSGRRTGRGESRTLPSERVADRACRRLGRTSDPQRRSRRAAGSAQMSS